MEGKKKGLWLLGGMIVGAFSVLGGAYLYYVNFMGTHDDLLGYWQSFQQFLTNNSFWLFAAIAILPAFIIPVAPLLTCAGIWGASEENGIVWAWVWASVSVLVNLTFTYWLAAGPGRKLIRSILRRTKYDIPKPDRNSELGWALILRLVPGVPFIFTNYALGIIRMPFRRYMIVSAPILIVTVGGYVLAVGGGLGQQWTYFSLGLAIIVVMILVGRIVSRRYGHDQQS
jgi:uncharacterized membrane protein YdjX (TVP38/TMEM64 family)